MSTSDGIPSNGNGNTTSGTRSFAYGGRERSFGNGEVLEFDIDDSGDPYLTGRRASTVTTEAFPSNRVTTTGGTWEKTHQRPNTSKSKAFDSFSHFGRKARKLSVRRRLLAVFAAMGVLFAGCMVVSFSAISSSRASTAKAEALTVSYATIDAAYQGWTQDDSQTNAYVALALYGNPSPQTLAAQWQQVVAGHMATVANLGKL